ncbi:MAG TPA: helix-turn-helix transcriptional regulator [Oceanipulchritudo sp.]|nr:helix-turn-helix transcriptional regulator [Oceanipulchritudo sp.]
MRHRVVIKHMVCQRCIETVGRIVREAGQEPLYVGLGELVLARIPDGESMEVLRKRLRAAGFDVAESETARLVSKVKSLIVERTHYNRGDSGLKLSAYLAQETGTDYDRLSRIFSATESITIERYATLQKIERVKELLAYGEMNVSEIADELGYSSAAHLSGQFKQVTGMTPSEFRELGARGRNQLDSLG